uniref:EGF-like domain-containing protein n=2 Tax=Octopus bimaculoides TaxID=37653 RepID=A0A0L8GAC7_OCTBM
MSEYKCDCQEGFTGHRCEVNINECLSNPCQNGGICIDKINGYICKCMKGITGKYCETNIDDCSPNRCQAKAACIDWVDDFFCKCPDGLAGKICNETQPGKKYIPCHSHICLNEGICFQNEFDKKYCVCPKGFKGPFCEINIDDCKPNPCLHNGTCTDLIDDFYCYCPSWLTGKICDETQPDKNFGLCEKKICFNDGVCLKNEFGVKYCVCPRGFKGPLCKTNIDDCTPNRCQGNGTCIDQIDNFHCRCPSWLTGQLCETKIGPKPLIDGVASTGIDGSTLAVLLLLFYGIAFIIIIIACIWTRKERRHPRDFCFEIPLNKYYNISDLM